MGFSDEEVVLFMLQHPYLMLFGLLVLLLGLIYLNISFMRKQGGLRSFFRSEPDIVIDWSQNLNEVELDFPLPPGAGSKDVELKLTSTSIRFAFKGKDSPELDGKLYRKIRSDDSNCEARRCCCMLVTLLSNIPLTAPTVDSHCTGQLWPVGYAPTHVKLNLVKQQQGMWKEVLLDADSAKDK